MKHFSHVEMLEALMRAGWRTRRSKGTHLRVYCPCGEHQNTVSTSNNGPGRRGEKNFLAWVRRCGDCTPPELRR